MIMATIKAGQKASKERLGEVRQGFTEEVTSGLDLKLSTRKKIA